MKAEITSLNDYITSMGVIKSFGGLCLNMTDKELPYGVNDDGKIFTTDDFLGTLAYTYIMNIRQGLKHGFVVTVGLNVFVSPKSVGEILPVYELPMWLFTKLKERYKDIRFSAKIDTRKYSHYELSTIEIDMPVYSICDDLELKAKIC